MNYNIRGGLLPLRADRRPFVSFLTIRRMVKIAISDRLVYMRSCVYAALEICLRQIRGSNRFLQ